MDQDQRHLDLLRKGDQKGLNALFKAYYRLVCTISFRIIRDKQIAEDIAQEVFLELWKKREQLKVTSSIKAYLSRAASNKTLNYIRDQKINLSRGEELEHDSLGAVESTSAVDLEDLKKKIAVAVQNLPDKCRLVFLLSRDQNMSYKEISEALDISTKTVENQISKALKFLRSQLGTYVAKLLIIGITGTLG